MKERPNADEVGGLRLPTSWGSKGETRERSEQAVPPFRLEPGATEGWAAQLRKGTLELGILGQLWDRPRYGLELLQRLEAAGLDIGEGTLYPILNRLRGDGLLASEWRQEGTGNPRKYYALTELGRARVLAMTEAWRGFTASMDQLVQPVDGLRSRP